MTSSYNTYKKEQAEIGLRQNLSRGDTFSSHQLAAPPRKQHHSYQPSWADKTILHIILNSMCSSGCEIHTDAFYTNFICP